MRQRTGQIGMLVSAAFFFALAGEGRADITTELSASILVFPKIIADGTRDTVIQITNTSNSLVRAHCFYVNAALTNPELPQGPLNPPLWIEVDFTIQLTRQQPTYWFVSEGRDVNPLERPCTRDLPFCPHAGFDPGHIPPVVPDFVGELKCVEVDDSGAPLSGNHLKGEATLLARREAFDTSTDPPTVSFGSSKYNAIGVLGEENNGDDILVLGGGQCAGNGVICTAEEDCGDQGPCVFEYNACPQTWILNHAADGAPDLVLNDNPLEGTATIDTELTVVPCTQNFETQIPTTVTLQFLTFNEFESQFSVSTSVTCWGNFKLGSIGSTALTFRGQLPDPQGTAYLQTRIRSANGTPFGTFMVAEETYRSKPSVSPKSAFLLATQAAFNLHVEGSRAVPDIITIPADQLAP